MAASSHDRALQEIPALLGGCRQSCARFRVGIDPLRQKSDDLYLVRRESLTLCRRRCCQRNIELAPGWTRVLGHVAHLWQYNEY